MFVGYFITHNEEPPNDIVKGTLGPGDTLVLADLYECGIEMEMCNTLAEAELWVQERQDQLDEWNS